MVEPRKRLTDEEYQFVFSRAVRLCLDFVIVKNGQLLLAKRDIEPCKGFWSLPGGMVRHQESINEASERIIKNELGLKIREKKLIGYIEFPDEINKDGVAIHSISMAFLTTLEDGEVVGSDQAHEIEFFTALPEKVHPTQGEFLKEHWQEIIG